MKLQVLGWLWHHCRRLHSMARESAKCGSAFEPMLGGPRSSLWPHARKLALENQKTCLACDTDDTLQVHHAKPFHDFPEDELKQSNLRVLCMGPNECHVKLGHGDSFQWYNPNVDADIAAFKAAYAAKDQAAMEAVWAKAKAARLANHGDA